MKTALFSVSYAGLWGQKRLDAAECVYKAADLGFDGILFMAKPPHLFPFDGNPVPVTKVEAALKETGLKTVGLAAYNDFLLPGPSEIPVEDMQVAYIKECCRLAARLGGELVRIFTGYRYPQLSEGQAWDRLVKLLRQCGDIAAEQGVRLAVQNHHDLAVGTEEMALLLDEVNHDAVRAGYDAWSPFLREETLSAGADLMASRAVLTIAANYRRYPRYTYHPENINYSRMRPDMVRAVTMNEGEIDYGLFFSRMMAGGFDGWAVYETCSPLLGGGSEENIDRYARDFISFLSKMKKRG